MHKPAWCGLFLAAAALDGALSALSVQKPRQKRQQNHGARNRPDKQLRADRRCRADHRLELNLVLRRPGATLALLHQQRPRPLDVHQLVPEAVLLTVVAGHNGDEPDWRPLHLGLEVRGAVGVKTCCSVTTSTFTTVTVATPGSPERTMSGVMALDGIWDMTQLSDRGLAALVGKLLVTTHAGLPALLEGGQAVACVSCDLFTLGFHPASVG